MRARVNFVCSEDFVDDTHGRHSLTYPLPNRTWDECAGGMWPKTEKVDLRQLRWFAKLGNTDRMRLFHSGRPQNARKTFARLPNCRTYINSARPLKPAKATVLDQLVLQTMPHSRSVKIEEFQFREK